MGLKKFPHLVFHGQEHTAIPHSGPGVVIGVHGGNLSGSYDVIDQAGFATSGYGYYTLHGTGLSAAGDVDGDGSVTALGDGLMVIRKLFGTAFAGESLTSKAMSKSATRTTDEIHEYIVAMSTVNNIF